MDLFKNVTVYQVDQPLDDYIEKITGAVEERAFVPNRPSQVVSTGFTPLAKHGMDACAATLGKGAFFFAIKRSTKRIPPKAIRQEVQARTDQIHITQQRKVYRKERLEINEEVVQDLLPKTPALDEIVYVMMDPKTRLVFISSATQGLVESITNFIREITGSFPIQFLTSEKRSDSVMTEWLLESSIDQDALLCDEAVLQSSIDDDMVMRLRGVDLSSDMVVDLVKHQGMTCQEVRIEWLDLSVTISTKTGVLRAIKWPDYAKERDGDDIAAQIDSDAVLMQEALVKLVCWLGTHFKWVTQNPLTFYKPTPTDS